MLALLLRRCLWPRRYVPGPESLQKRRVQNQKVHMIGPAATKKEHSGLCARSVLPVLNLSARGADQWPGLASASSELSACPPV